MPKPSSPKQERDTPWSQLVGCLTSLSSIKLYLLFVVAAFALYFDPLGISTTTERISEKSFERLAAPWYGSPALSTRDPDHVRSAAAHSGHQELVVVLITDSYLKTREVHWPLPYKEQSGLFRRILKLEPSALFVDLIYRHNHSSPTNFQKLASIEDSSPVAQDLCNGSLRELQSVLQNRRGKENNIPVVLAAPYKDAADTVAVNCFPPSSGAIYHAAVSWAGADNRYPFEVGGLVTPAALLYGMLYQKPDQSIVPEPPSTDALQATLEVEDERPSMAIRWGRYAPDSQSNFVTDTDEFRNCYYSGLWEQLKDSGLGALTSIFYRTMEWSNTDCPYHLTIRAESFFSRDEETKKQLARLLQGRAVLLGASIEGANDLAPSPVRGLIPGIFHHAMALDNLIEFGDDYYRDAPNVFGPMSSVEVIEAFVLIFSLAYLVMLGSHRTPLSEANSWTIRVADKDIYFYRRGLIIWASTLVTVVLICVFLVIVKRYTIANWIGLLLVSALPLIYMVDHQGESLATSPANKKKKRPKKKRAKTLKRRRNNEN